jgi:hypothetical protein
VPSSKIAGLSSGEFVGMVADDPDNKIALKAFHCEILNDIPAIQKEEAAYKEIPVIRKIDRDMVERNFLQIKEDVFDIAHSEMDRMMSDPALSYLVIKKK